MRPADVNVGDGFVNMAMDGGHEFEASPWLSLVPVSMFGGGLEREQEEREDVGAEPVHAPARRRGRELVLEKEE